MMLKLMASKHTLLFSSILVLISSLITSIDVDGKHLSGCDFALTRIIVILYLILIMKHYAFMRKKEFSLSKFPVTIIGGIPLMVIGAGSTLMTNSGVITFQKLPMCSTTLKFVLNMLLIGIVEELLYRGVVFNCLLKKWETHKNYPTLPIIVSALFFGLAHFVNVFTFSLPNVFMQVINSTCSGVLFATLYWKFRNMLGIIVVHALTDFLALFAQELFPSTSSSIVSASMSIAQIIIALLFGAGVPLLTAYIIYRKVPLSNNINEKVCLP